MDDKPKILNWPDDLFRTYSEYVDFKAYDYTNRIDSYNFDSGKTIRTSRLPKNLNDYKSQIRLPIPESVEYSDGISWNTESLTAIGLGSGNVIKNADTTEGLTKSLTGLAGDLKTQVALGIISKVQGLTTVKLSENAITQSAARKIRNPYLEQIFQGMSMRSFSFNWKLVPKSADEQVDIYTIIKEFRRWSIPSSSEKSNVKALDTQLPLNADSPPPSNETTSSPVESLTDRWLDVPCAWDIKFRYINENKDVNTSEEMTYLVKLKPCIIKDINVNYTPDGMWSAHTANDYQPAPVAYNLNIIFEEIEIITREDVVLGY